LGLDRIPEVRTLRRKVEILCREAGRAMRWNTELAKEWIAGQRESELVFCADGHAERTQSCARLRHVRKRITET
jgi:hypothetical protein